MKRLLWIVIALGFVAGVPVARADDAAKVFAAQCVSCHGADGKGQTPLCKQIAVRDWSDPKTLKPMSDVELEKMISAGKKLMPGFATLGAPQIKSLVAYVRSFEPK
ncbi:hypothetical protein BH11MYX1_BH11MYX1_52030 [soil metagenome]